MRGKRMVRRFISMALVFSLLLWGEGGRGMAFVVGASGRDLTQTGNGRSGERKSDAGKKGDEKAGDKKAPTDSERSRDVDKKGEAEKEDHPSGGKDFDDKKSDEKKPDKKKSDEKKSDEKKSDEKKSDEKKPDEKKSDEKKSDEKKSDEKKSDEKKSDEKKPDEKKPDEKKSDDKKADEKDSDEKKSDEKKADEKKLDEKKSDEKKPDEKKSDEKKPDEEKSDEKKSDEKKSDEEKSDEKKSDEKKSDEKKSDDKKTDEKQSEDKEADDKETGSKAGREDREARDGKAEQEKAGAENGSRDKETEETLSENADSSGDSGDFESPDDFGEENVESGDTESDKRPDDEIGIGALPEKEAGMKGMDAALEQTPGMEDEESRGPEITEFYAKEDHINTKESEKWYAAYDEGQGKTHVTFFVVLSEKDPCKVTICAEDGSREKKFSARRVSGSRGEYSGDFDEEGTWRFFVEAEDAGGGRSKKGLTNSSSHSGQRIVIDNSRPEVSISYEGSTFDEEGAGGTVYYGKKSQSLAVEVDDPLASNDYYQGEDAPDFSWDAPESVSMNGKKTISGTHYKRNYRLTREGDYSFELSYSSRNGREPVITEHFSSGMQKTLSAAAYSSRQIVVDHTPPKLRSVTVDAGKNLRYKVAGRDCIFLKNSPKEKVRVRCVIEEEHLSGSGAGIFSEDKEVQLPCEVTGKEGGALVLETSFDISSWEAKEEGMYRLSLGTLVDQAKNVWDIDTYAGSGGSQDQEGSLASLWFVIDRTAPVVTACFPAPKKLVTDSGRIPGNSTELFYEDQQDVRLEIKEENYIAGVSDEQIFVLALSKATDEAEDYRKKVAKIQSVEEGAGEGCYGCVITGLSGEEGHSYFTVDFEDPCGNPAMVKTVIEGYEETGGSGKTGKESGEDADLGGGGQEIWNSPVMTIDRTEPVLSLSCDSHPAAASENRRFFHKAQTVTVTITDENFSLKDLSSESFAVKCSAYDLNPDTKDPAAQVLAAEWEKGDTWDQGTYVNGKKEYRATVRLTGRWNYDVWAEAEDIVGHKAATGEAQVTIDDEKPCILIRDIENTSGSDVHFQGGWSGEKVRFYDYARFGYFHKGGIRVKITAWDDVAGVAAIKYTVSHDDGRVVRGEWSFKKQSRTQTRYLTIPADVRAKISLVPVDHGNLVGEKVDPRGSVTETEGWHKTHSGMEIRINTEPAKTVGSMKYFHTAVSADIIMDDDHSGIAGYRYKAGKSLSGEHDYTEDVGTKDRKGSPATEILYEKTIHVEIPAGDANYSDKDSPTEISASFKDNAGYESSKKESFVMDDQKPEIEVKWDEAPSTPDQKYFRADRTAVIHVKERNFDEAGVRWKMKSMGGVQIGSWSHRGDHHTCRVSFTRDGEELLLDFAITDLARNTASCPAQQPFSIDKTPPVLKITFDNNEVTNRSYYNRARTAVLVVEEKSFQASEVKCVFHSENGGRKKNLYSSGNWTGSGGIYKNTVVCAEDGAYHISMDYTDLAGNHAVAKVREDFVIDKTAPKVVITGVRDGGAYNDVVAPAVEYSDQNLDPESVTILLTGSKCGRADYRWKKVQDLPGGRRIQWKDFAREESVDDIYTLDLFVMDRAGNVNRSRRTVFTVNRFGSRYRFSSRTAELVENESPYVTSPISLDITEVNVSRLKSSTVTVKNENNEIATLRDGPDYSVTRREDRYGFSEYTYHIKAENFSNEGDYSVTISSVDAALNRMTNVTRGRQIRFVIDQTRPYGSITGLEARSYKEDRHEISLRADDNYALKEAELLINGEKVKTYSAEDFSENAGVTEVLKERRTVQRVSLRLTDQAGNVRTVLPYGNPNGTLITADRLLLLYHDFPRVFALACAASLLLFGGIWLGLKQFLKK